MSQELDRIKEYVNLYREAENQKVSINADKEILSSKAQRLEIENKRLREQLRTYEILQVN